MLAAPCSGQPPGGSAPVPPGPSTGHRPGRLGRPVDPVGSVGSVGTEGNAGGHLRSGEWLAGRVENLDLAQLVRPTPTREPGRFALDVPDGLQQGRGAWGGLATGGMTAAAQLADPRPEMAVRTLSAQLVAPVMVGRALVGVEVLRRGSGTTTVAVRMTDEAGALLAHGVVVLGSARAGEAMPDGAAWLSLEPPPELAAGPGAAAVAPVGPPLGPDFTVHLEFRPVSGLPFQGTGAAGDLAQGWVRPRGPVSTVDASVVAALADAWWVAVLPGLDRPRPVATLGFTLDLPGDPTALPRTGDGILEPLFHRGRVVAAREGFTVETRELWTAAGDLISWNTQTVAVIK